MEWLTAKLVALRADHLGQFLGALLLALWLVGLVPPSVRATFCGSWLNNPAPETLNSLPLAFPE